MTGRITAAHYSRGPACKDDSGAGKWWWSPPHTLFFFFVNLSFLKNFTLKCDSCPVCHVSDFNTLHKQYASSEHQLNPGDVAANHLLPLCDQETKAVLMLLGFPGAAW